MIWWASTSSIRSEVREQSSPFLLTSGFGSHVANPSYAVML